MFPSRLRSQDTVMIRTLAYTSVVILAVVLSTDGKVYEKCELAKELRDKHGITKEHIPTWVCIAKHESTFNTSAINYGSGDHGLFQISQLFWCNTKPSDYKACGISCDDLKNDDISDDIICAKRIHREHKRLSGDGFNAWVVYGQYCRGLSFSYVSECFNNYV